MSFSLLSWCSDRCKNQQTETGVAGAGGTDRAVGVAPDSPEGSPWHQGPSPTYSLPGEAYPGPAGRYLGSETPPFEERAAKAPWHQPAPAER